MVNITLNIAEPTENAIQKLIKNKILPSRSEAIRIALREFLWGECQYLIKLLEVCQDGGDKIETK